jgi:membrane-bound ClpP family serine protease
MADNPYAAPQARVADRSQLRVPGDITSNIRNAVVAGLVVAGLQLLLVVLGMAGVADFGLGAWGLVDVAIVVALVYGVHRRSRTCAILLLALFVVGRILFMVEQGKPTGIIVAFAIAYYLARGVQGTFQYHAFMRDPATSESYGKALDAATSDRIAAMEALRNPAPARDEQAAPDTRG